MIRPATAQDFVDHFKSPPRTAMAWVVEETEPLGIIGFYHYQGAIAMFAEIKADARQKCKWPARTMLVAGRFLLEQAQKTGMKICAVADPRVQDSVKLLQRLGFEKGYKETFIWAPPHSR